MEDVLAVYTRPRDPDCPVVCFDETSKQLVAETRLPVAMKKGRSARFDYEYERNGTANLFMMFAPLEGWRHVKVTDRRTAVDYAQARQLAQHGGIRIGHPRQPVPRPPHPGQSNHNQRNRRLASRPEPLPLKSRLALRYR